MIFTLFLIPLFVSYFYDKHLLFHDKYITLFLLQNKRQLISTLKQEVEISK